MQENLLYIQDFALKLVQHIDELRTAPGGPRQKGLLYAVPGEKPYPWRMRALKPETDGNMLLRHITRKELYLVVHGDENNKILLEL